MQTTLNFDDGRLHRKLDPLVGFRIERVDHATAKEWVEKWHYSGRIPTGKNYLFGLFDGCELYAVAVYGTGVNPYQAKFLEVDSVVELKRLARSDPKRDYPMTKFISKTVKMLKQEVKFQCLVSFSDPDAGHEGTLYKAAGFKFAGLTNAEWHLIDKDGNKRHRRYAFRYARRKNISVADARDELGVARIKTSPKRRWVRYFVKTPKWIDELNKPNAQVDA